MVGVILYNLALFMAISVPKVIIGSTILSTVLYTLVGLLGAMAILISTPMLTHP
jgi:uncharacterized membrane protein YuzA (DUF378 family)